MCYYWRRGHRCAISSGAGGICAPIYWGTNVPLRQKAMFTKHGKPSTFHRLPLRQQYWRIIRKMIVFRAPHLFSSQSPINWALQTGNGKTLKKRRRLHKKIKQTSITTVRYNLRTLASFSTPLMFNWSLHLKWFLANFCTCQIFYFTVYTLFFICLQILSLERYGQGKKNKSLFSSKSIIIACSLCFPSLLGSIYHQFFPMGSCQLISDRKFLFYQFVFIYKEEVPTLITHYML